LRYALLRKRDTVKLKFQSEIRNLESEINPVRLTPCGKKDGLWLEERSPEELKGEGRVHFGGWDEVAF
jgi:hypothetical protein